MSKCLREYGFHRLSAQLCTLTFFPALSLSTDTVLEDFRNAGLVDVRVPECKCESHQMNFMCQNIKFVFSGPSCFTAFVKVSGSCGSSRTILPYLSMGFSAYLSSFLGLKPYTPNNFYPLKRILKAETNTPLRMAVSTPNPILLYGAEFSQ